MPKGNTYMTDKLFVAGCSHTEGFEITETDKLHDADLELRWSGVLAKKLKRTQVNISRGGADIEMVADFALENIDSLTSRDIAVIQWPEPMRLVRRFSRFDAEYGFYRERINNYTRKHESIPSEIKLLNDIYFEIYADNVLQEKRFLNLYLMVDSLFQQKQIPLFHTMVVFNDQNFAHQQAKLDKKPKGWMKRMMNKVFKTPKREYGDEDWMQREIAFENDSFAKRHWLNNKRVISKTKDDTYHAFCSRRGHKDNVDGRYGHFMAPAHKQWAEHLFEIINPKAKHLIDKAEKPKRVKRKKAQGKRVVTGSDCNI